MEPQTVAAESSPAPVMEIERGPLVLMTHEQRSEFRRTGNMPEPAKTEPSAESAPADKSEAEETEVSAAETSPASEAAKPKQEPPRSNAQSRKAELTAEIKELLKQRDTLKTEVSKPTPKAESSPAKFTPSPRYTRIEPTIDAKNEDGTQKYATYEEFTKDLGRWSAEQLLAEQRAEAQKLAQQREIQSKINDAKTRYENFDETIKPALTAITQDANIPQVVKAMFNDSEVLPDLLFTLGSDAKELASFIEMAANNPGKALRYIALTESLIQSELESKSAPKEVPAKPQTTAAPKPPAEVGGRATTPHDALVAAAEANDFRSFKAESNRRALAKLKA